MFKRLDIRRDLITIGYLTMVVTAIGLYFGSGSITFFLGKMQTLYPPETIGAKIREFYVLVSSEGSLGTTRNRELFEDVVVSYVLNSIPIIISAFALALPLGMAKGIFDYRKKNSPLSSVGHGFTSLILSLPDFFLIIALQWIILFNFRFIDWFGNDQWYNFILPSILVALYPMMYFARVTSASLSNEEGAMYIQTARSFGLPEKLVIKKHILKKNYISIIHHIPAVMTYILSNLLMVEWLLDYKGAAWRLLYAIKRSNDPKNNEMWLAVELSLCFMLFLFASQVVTIILQQKYQVEKSNFLLEVLKTFTRYLFISFFICLILILISMTPQG